MNEELEKLYKAVSAKFDIGTFEEFQSKMDTPEKMQNFYKAVSSKGYDLGDYGEYEKRLLGKPEEVSGQGSQNTSEELPEPLETSQEDNLNTELQIGLAQSEDTITLPDGAVAIPDSSGGFIIPDEENPEDLSMGEYYNPIQPVEVTATIEDDTTVGGRIYNSVMSSLEMFNEGIVSRPEFLNAFSVAILNLPSEALRAIGMEDLAESIRIDPEQSWENLKRNNMTLRYLAELSDYYARNSEAYRQQLPEDYGNIENSIRQGNYLRAGEELVSGILGATPSVLYLLTTGGVGASTSVANLVGQTFIKTLPFSASNYRELQREGVEVPNGLLPVYSAMNGMVEILDANIGASSFLRREIMAGRMKSEGVQDFITGYLSKSFKENGIPFAILRGSASEGIVQLSHNIIDKYSGIDPDRGLMDNVANGMIIGGGMSGSIVSIGKLGNAISNKEKDRKSVV